VANSDIGYKIDIQRLSDDRFAIKDDTFPGVVYRNLKNVKSALIFHSGKVIFTGVKNRQHVEEAYD
jgi:TATA-box binding protein (TBP) (component of TFIID and TFIIIB)